MPNTAQSRVEEVINQFSVPTRTRNIYGVMGPTKRGKINDPRTIIYSWSQFEKEYGGLVNGNDFPLLCKRALERGAALRVCNIKHYTDITSAASLDAVLATIASTDKVELDTALTADHTMQVTINGNAITQAFTISSKRTLELLALKVVATIPAIVETALAVDATTLILIPKTAVTLTTTSIPTGTDAPEATVTQVATITDGTDELFKLKPIAKGADYNNLAIYITSAVSGDTNAFDLRIVHLVDGTSESYPGLKIPGKPTIAQSSFLDRVKRNSKLVEVEYIDLSAATANTLKPQTMILRYKSGTDGSALVSNDYIGSSSSNTGMQAFNAYDDMIAICAPNLADSVVHLAGDTYAFLRKDLEYHGHLSNASTTEDALITERDTIGVTTSYSRFFAGGVLINDPFTGQERGISEMGDVMGIIGHSFEKFGAHYSASGKRRGGLINCLGVVNNFGAKSNILNLNRLANRQINTVIERDGVVMLWGNFTATIEDNSTKWANVRSMLIDMRKSILPLLDNYIEEPNDIPSWRDLYRDVIPYLDSQVANRAIHSYNWQGDQFAESLEKLQINTLADVQQGKYKVKLFVKEVVSMQDILVEITLDNSTISFEESIVEANNL